MEGFGRITVRRIVLIFEDKVSRALLASGLKPDDKVALISPNRPEWNFYGLWDVASGHNQCAYLSYDFRA